MNAKQRRAAAFFAEAMYTLQEEDIKTLLSLTKGYLRTDSEQFLVAIKYLIGTRTGQSRETLDDTIALLLIFAAKQWPNELHENNKYLLGPSCPNKKGQTK